MRGRPAGLPRGPWAGICRVGPEGRRTTGSQFQTGKHSQGEPNRMLEKLQARRQSEEGFTLIELMVVVLIIAILLAIAIPTFLGARGKAQDRAAQSNLRNALTAEKTFFTDQQVYTATTTALTAIEPSLNYVP